MNQREFIAGLGSVAAWQRVVRAQQLRLPLIGFLHAETPRGFMPYAAAFAEGLRESGFVEGDDVTIEYRWGNGQLEQLPALAADLVRRRVTLIVAGGGAASAVAAKAATSAIPIVIVFGSNPISLGLAASLNRPGGNVTGVTFFTAELMSKRLGLLRELAPQAVTVGYLADDPRVYTPSSMRVLEEMRRDILAAARGPRPRDHCR